jgi:RNA polymerase sigma-70 factor (ECF subfamily)
VNAVLALNARLADSALHPPRSQSLDTRAALNRFLADIERRALRMAELALGNGDDALDAVQDAMIGLVEHYAARPESEWRPLFHTILQSRIRDRQRRQSVKNRVIQWLGGSRQNEDEEGPDWLEQLADPAGVEPGRWLDSGAAGQAIVAALSRLPLRQQQCFLLRLWEGLDVAATAQAMGCSEGSVKTHLSRALAALRGQLKEYAP